MLCAGHLSLRTFIIKYSLERLREQPLGFRLSHLHAWGLRPRSPLGRGGLQHLHHLVHYSLQCF